MVSTRARAFRTAAPDRHGRGAGRWIARLIILSGVLAAGVAECSRAAADEPAAQIAPRLAQASLDGNYFSAGGQRLLVTGAHWVPAQAALHWPLQWEPADIEGAFSPASQSGFNTSACDPV